jgi:hypothetical protein
LSFGKGLIFEKAVPLEKGLMILKREREKIGYIIEGSKTPVLTALF